MVMHLWLVKLLVLWLIVHVYFGNYLIKSFVTYNCAAISNKYIPDQRYQNVEKLLTIHRLILVYINKC